MAQQSNKQLPRNNQWQPHVDMPESTLMTCHHDQGFHSEQSQRHFYKSCENHVQQQLLPTLARLSLEKRWIIWIAPPSMPNITELVHHGIDINRVIVMSHSQIRNQFQAVEQALMSCSYSAVVGWFDELSTEQHRRLYAAARQGNCHGFIFQTSPHAQGDIMINPVNSGQNRSLH